MSNLSKDALTKEQIDLAANHFGLFRAEVQQKNLDGKKKWTKCLYMCPPKELSPTPASGTKWFDNLKVLPLKWESKRLLGTRNDDFKRVQEDLSILVRQLAMTATNATKSAARTKNNRKRDSEGETKEEEGSLAKKQKLAEPRCSLSKFDTAILADGDETGPSLN